MTLGKFRKSAIYWLLAARPKTLVASVIPVTLGGCLSFQQTGEMNYFLISLCLIFALLIQVSTNFYNDYFDHLSGADSKRKLGPKRLAEAGLIDGKKLRNFAFIILVIAFGIGIFIMEYSGASRLLLFVGITSVLCAFGYTGGPYPLAYNGLGDLFVIIFFGFVAICSTHYVLVIACNEVWVPNWLVPLGVGFQINNLLVVNNYRDRITDKDVGKRTLVVLLGKNFGVLQYFLGYSIPCIICPILDNKLDFLFFLWPVGVFLNYKMVKAKSKKNFNSVLGLTSSSIVLYGALLAWLLAKS